MIAILEGSESGETDVKIVIADASVLIHQEE
jgi:hypothetical protein